MKPAQSQLSFFEKAKSLPQRSVSVAAFRGESHVLSILYLTLGLCVAGYLYFVGVSIMNLIANREAVVQSERLQTDVAVLEQEFFELSKGVTPAAADDHGLLKPVHTSFTKRDTGFATNITNEDL
ncbi:MAG: hypothetical protein WA021_01970 [Minisyncoccia bacterium]